MRKILHSLALAIVAIAGASAQAPADAIAGRFSVSDGKQVYFAKGNLQYTQSTQTWAFATRQTDYIGTANITTDTNGNKVFADKIDLFGWGTGDNPTNASSDINDYQTFVDWGTNTIGTDAPDTWRTLASTEWAYLFFTRTHASTLWGLGIVNDVYGVILLPDDWELPAGVRFSPSTQKGLADMGGYYNSTNTDSHWEDNTYTLSEWRNMEEAGAVFLPAAGGRGQKVSAVQQNGYYWSSTQNNQSTAYILYFCNQSLHPTDNFICKGGLSVRLVKNYSNVSTDAASPSATDTAPARKLLRNGQVLIERNGKTYTLTGTEVK